MEMDVGIGAGKTLMLNIDLLAQANGMLANMKIFTGFRNLEMTLLFEDHFPQKRLSALYDHRDRSKPSMKKKL